MPTIFVVPAGEYVCREIYSADRVQSRAWPVPTRAASSCEFQDHTPVGAAHSRDRTDDRGHGPLLQEHPAAVSIKTTLP